MHFQKHAESLTSSQARGKRIISKQRCQPSGAAATALKAALQQMISDELVTVFRKLAKKTSHRHAIGFTSMILGGRAHIFHKDSNIFPLLKNRTCEPGSQIPLLSKNSAPNEPWSLLARLVPLHRPRNIGLRTLLRHRLQQVTSLACFPMFRKKTNK